MTEVGLAPPGQPWAVENVDGVIRDGHAPVLDPGPVAQLTMKAAKCGAVWQTKACRMSLPGGSSGAERSASPSGDVSSVRHPVSVASLDEVEGQIAHQHRLFHVAPYVRPASQPTFDAPLSLALFAGFVSVGDRRIPILYFGCQR